MSTSAWPRATLVLLSVAAAMMVIGGLRAAGSIVGPVMLALCLTILFHPVRQRLSTKVPGWVASVVVLVLAYVTVLLLALALVVSVGQVASLVPHYSAKFGDLVTSAGDWLAARGVGHDQAQAAVKSVDVGKIVGVATSVLSSILSALSNLTLILMLMLFMAFDAASADDLMGGVRRARPDLANALGSFTKGVRSYLGVSAGFGLIVALLDYIALVIVGVPGAFVWGVLSFVTNFIPNIGFLIGLVPPALLALLDGGVGLMVFVIVAYVVLNFLVQTVIQPRIVGNQVGISATLSFVSLMFWSWVIGPAGTLLAIPMTLLLKALLVDADPAARWLDPLITGRAEPKDSKPSPAQG